jgi:F-type H+-transporting ATPase subunit epsilon
MADLSIEIVTPAKITFSGDAKSISIPGVLGNFQVLHNHAPLISVFEIGLVKVNIDNTNILYFATGGGTVEVLNNNVLILADSLEAVEAIDLERAKRAVERAKRRLEARGPETDLDRAQTALKRAINRIQIVEKYLRGDVVKEKISS